MEYKSQFICFEILVILTSIGLSFMDIIPFWVPITFLLEAMVVVLLIPSQNDLIKKYANPKKGVNEHGN